ncbi:hypothetical protein Cgig2_021658 [Carnegiea gigantea]|uniref:Thioredoxin domain-containing protein n=1 Tax=Carnegiea gigantea TaxID=171969 RepID=A0A9Q1K920_9CARY|nr:hypothetical protein Cgig2_021658 [Carnegiea gigantea]
MADRRFVMILSSCLFLFLLMNLVPSKADVIMLREDIFSDKVLIIRPRSQVACVPVRQGLSSREVVHRVLVLCSMIRPFCDPGNYACLSRMEIKEKDTAWFVQFCVPWCKHCKNLGSLWEDLGKAMEGEDEIEIGQVDCSVSKPVCSKVDIHSYPTFKVFYNGEEVAKYQGNCSLCLQLAPVFAIL